jgi:hypothetical protein
MVCKSFGPGHNTHWIQLRLSTNDPRDRREGVVVELSGPSIVVRFNETTERFLAHNSRDLQVGTPVVVDAFWSLLTYSAGDDQIAVSVLPVHEELTSH